MKLQPFILQREAWIWELLPNFMVLFSGGLYRMSMSQTFPHILIELFFHLADVQESLSWFLYLFHWKLIHV